MVKALLWDNDGVLVDTEPLYYRANRDELRERGIELTREDYLRVSLVEGRSCVSLAAEQGASPEEVARMKESRDARYESLLARGARVLEGVRDCLRALHGRQPMAIVTSAPSRHFRQVHAGTELLDYFEFALTPDDYHRHKPHPEPYLRAAQRLGVEPAECVVVEDSERGLRSAVAAGMRCLAVPHELTRGGDFSRAWRVLQSVREVQAAVEELRRAS